MPGKKHRFTRPPKRTEPPENAALPRTIPITPPPPRWFNRAINLIVGAYLALLFDHVVSMVWLSLGFPWSSSSDENVQVAEVVRFANLDFHQRFFDMPGTPLWMLGAAEWRVYYFFAAFFQSLEGSSNIFTFDRLQPLFTLMRVNNLVFYLLSGVLLFLIVNRLSNRFAAAVATTILMLNPAYGVTVASVRVEPMSMCFLLSAVLLAIQSRSPWKWLWAGMLGGAAAACRLHSVTLTVPILLLLLFTRTWSRRKQWTARFRRLTHYLAGASLLLSALLIYALGFSHSPLRAADPLGFSLLAKANLVCFGALVALTSAYFIPRARPMIEKLVTPDLLLLSGGLSLGWLSGVPTIFTQFKFFVRSLDFYQGLDYRDFAAVQLPVFQKLATYFRFYAKEIAPDKVTLVLLIAGCCLILASKRYRRLMPYLIVAAAFFVSKPWDLLRVAHHVALWIPFFALICSVPFMALASLATKPAVASQPAARFVFPVIGIVALIVLRLTVWGGLDGLRLFIAANHERIHNIEVSRNWFRANTPNGTTIVVAFYCFGPEIFYHWLSRLGLQVPPQPIDHQFVLWWGDKKMLKGYSGYACMSPEDLTPMTEREVRTPGDGVNPYRDGHFHLLRSFGQGSTRIDALDFDFH